MNPLPSESVTRAGADVPWACEVSGEAELPLPVRIPPRSSVCGENICLLSLCL